MEVEGGGLYFFFHCKNALWELHVVNWEFSSCLFCVRFSEFCALDFCSACAVCNQIPTESFLHPTSH